jgi:hypothetical protein
LNRSIPSSILFWLLAGVATALLAALALIVGGRVPIDPATKPDVTSPEALVQQVTTPPLGVTTEPVTTAETTPKAVEATVVVISALHGDCWFSARVGSESGKVLDERLLAQGETVRLRAARIWLSIGASANLEVTVNGEPAELPPGTVSVLLPQTVTTDANAAR